MAGKPTLKDFAKGHLAEAENRLETARNASQNGKAAYCIRQCQEAVELALKAALNFVGVEYPRYHDVGPILRDVTRKFPNWLQPDIGEFARLSGELAEKREPAMYGAESIGIPAERLFSRDEARHILDRTETAFRAVRKLVNG